MSFECTIAKAISLNSLNKSLINLNEPQQQQQQLEQDPQQQKSIDQSKYCSEESSGKYRGKVLKKSITKPTTSLEFGTQSDGKRGECPKQPTVCHSLIERILYTVNELEQTLVEDHQQDYRLRIMLAQQTEKIDHLRCSLQNEKQRNQRLVQLIRGVDSSSSTGDEAEQVFNTYRMMSKDGNKGTGRWQSRSSIDAYESISPLLMQQRFDELSMSHKQCQRQLAKREKMLTLAKCDREELQAKYEHLLDEYRTVQRRFEEMCCKYLRLQSKKNHEIQKLRDALTYASDCLLSAQQVMDGGTAVDETATHFDMEFRQNFQLFIRALRLCDWVQHSCSQSSSKSDIKLWAYSLTAFNIRSFGFLSTNRTSLTVLLKLYYQVQANTDCLVAATGHINYYSAKPKLHLL